MAGEMVSFDSVLSASRMNNAIISVFEHCGISGAWFRDK